MTKTYERFVIGFTGKNGAGKTLGVEHVAAVHGARPVGFGLLLRDITDNALLGMDMPLLAERVVDVLHLPQDRDMLRRMEWVMKQTFGRDLSGVDRDNRSILQELSTNLRHPRTGFGDRVLAHAVYEQIRAGTTNSYAVDSVRREVDIALLRRFSFFRLCYVHAGIRTRYLREVQRARSAGDAAKSFAQFKREDRQESEVQIAGLRAAADFVIHNHAGVTPAAYCAKIDREVAMILH